MNVFSKPILHRKIRLAPVGCGRIAKNHTGAIAKLADHWELVDVCDIVPAHAAAQPGSRELTQD
jgi:UDP-N-acetyl-2-amino-2-deoxyglucuronate dehydrogenase